MKHKKFANMSRDQVIAAMANKLAEGNSQVIAKPCFRLDLKSAKVVVPIIGILGVVLLLVILLLKDGTDENVKGREKSTSNDLVSALNPLIKLNAAFEKKEISAEQYACYLRDLIVRYDSIPDNFRLARPIINQKEVYSELAAVWELINPGLRMKISEDLPAFRSKQTDLEGK